MDNGAIVLSVRKFKAGYEVREELHRTNFEAISVSKLEQNKEIQDLINTICTPSDVIVKSAYTSTGDYIGNQKTAYFLIKKKGIKPELADKDDNVCSIGFCEREQKWYGWSHRAIFGFGIGDIVKEGDCTNSSGYTDTYLNEHPEKNLSLPVGYIAKDLNDAKKMAIAFADSVG